MYKLCFYVPESHLEAVKVAVFAAGAGAIGDYDRCCWQVLGQGQFRPMAGSSPHLGRLGRQEQVPEYKVEIVCEAAFVREAVQAMKAAHPYEEPAWDLIELVTELPD